MDSRRITVDEIDWVNEEWRAAFLRDRVADGWEFEKTEDIPDRHQRVAIFRKVQQKEGGP
jgi:hypothetical protein